MNLMHRQMLRIWKFVPQVFRLTTALVIGTVLGNMIPAQQPTPAGQAKRRAAIAMPGTPTIDGKVDEAWNQAPVFKTDRPVAELNDKDVDQPSVADFRCLWDKTHLYVLLEVADNRISHSNQAAWEQDSIEVFVDEDAGFQSTYQNDDGQYRVGVNGEVSYGESGRYNNAKAAVVKNDQGYVVELAIEISAAKPQPGRNIGFEVQVNNDAGVGRRQTIMKWNSPTNRSWLDPSSFGVLHFSTPETKKADLKKIYESGRQTAAVGNRPDPRPVFEMERVPGWASEAIYYQIFTERFRNGDPSNDPTRESLEFPDVVPDSWRVSSWSDQWYRRAPWEQQMGDNFYEDGVFHRRYGGDLQGVLEKLDYLNDLGINCIYFNPVFYARSMHKYDGNSFHHIDPYFGPDPTGDFEIMARETADPATWQWTQADRLFLKLVQQAHERDIRIVIDGVFNHTGRDFFAFADIASKGQQSSYVDWYIVEQFDDPDTPENEFKYKGWWGVETLPEFADNADGTDLHPKPKAYVFKATSRWMDPNGDGDPSDGIDGWRLDVANEVPNKFWRDWNRLVRELNPHAFTVAEIWQDAGDYLADCGFSATMNYHGFAFPVKGFLVDGRLTATQFQHELTERMNRHSPRVQFALQNLMDSHDTDRLASMIVNAKYNRSYRNAGRFDYDVGERVSPRHFREYDVSRPGPDERRRQRLVALFQMTFLGAPMIYYGTESGMDGADDPDDRMPMVWDDIRYENRDRGPWGELDTSMEIRFESDLHAFYKALFGLRRNSSALNHGKLQFLAADDDHQTVVFARQDQEQTVIIALNRGEQEYSLDIDLQQLGFVGDALAVQRVFTSTGEDSDQVQVNGTTARIALPGNFGSAWTVSGNRQP